MYQDPTRRTLTILVWVLAALLVIVAAGAVVLTLRQEDAPAPTLPPMTTEPSTAPTTEPTTAPTTEPQPEVFTLTFAGDCTFGNRKERSDADTFIAMVGKQYDYPFSKVIDYFADDECTFINLEGPLTDGGTASDKKFVFKGPTDYVNIMLEGSVEFANVANNHSYDYGKSGYADTLDVLKENGIEYAESGTTTLFTTQNGLKIGVYAELYPEKSDGVVAGVKKLRDAGAEVVIASLHWGVEYHYNPNKTQENIGHAAIDAGADIVYGHHPHVLQKIEEYNGGIIYYSLANFSFGGNTNPIDKDSAIIQQEIIRHPDGTVELGQTTAIPVLITGINPGNDFRPLPMEEDSEGYDRVLTKLAGDHNVDVLYVPYRDDINGTETTEPTEPTQGETVPPTVPEEIPTEPEDAPTEPAQTPQPDPDPET